MKDLATPRRRKLLALAAFAVVAVNAVLIVALASGAGRPLGLTYFSGFGVLPIAFIAVSLAILVAVGRARRNP